MLNHIVSSFDKAFKLEYQTVLVGGADEPLYQPSSDLKSNAVIYFREDFVSSALHEVAHWCLAGEARRKLSDYGYWYKADRDIEAQIDFESVEVLPQAIEWILSNAAGIPFNVSSDNLSLENYDALNFRQKVHEKVNELVVKTLPLRVEKMALALSGNSDDYLAKAKYMELPGR